MERNATEAHQGGDCKLHDLGTARGCGRFEGLNHPRNPETTNEQKKKVLGLAAVIPPKAMNNG